MVTDAAWAEHVPPIAVPVVCFNTIEKWTNLSLKSNSHCKKASTSLNLKEEKYPSVLLGEILSRALRPPLWIKNTDFQGCHPFFLHSVSQKNVVALITLSLGMLGNISTRSSSPQKPLGDSSCGNLSTKFLTSSIEMI